MKKKTVPSDELVPHIDLVYRVCRRFMDTVEDAEDCAQETFVRAVRGFSSFRRKAQVSTWLYTIAVRTCMRALSKQSSRRSKVAPVERPISDGRYAPEHILEMSELQQAALECVRTLPAKRRTIVMLREIEGKSYDEISRIVGTPKGTVRSSLARGRDQVVRELRRRGYEM